MHVLLVDGPNQWQAIHVKAGNSILVPIGAYCQSVQYDIRLFRTFHGVEYFVGISDKTKLPRGMQVQLKIQEMGIEPPAESHQYSNF
jgi:hypothetical protein